MRPFLKTRIFGIALAAGLAASPLAMAEEHSCPVPTTDSLVKLLAPPPCDTCAETKAEIEELKALQHDRTEAQAKHAADDADITIKRFLAGGDIKYDAAAFEKCQPIFDRLSQLTKEAAVHAKDFFCRLRPYQVPDSGLPAPDKKFSPSYPSGHTTFGTAVGAVLAQMVPEKSDVLLARSADYGHSRMVLGVHYRSDVEAGKILGAEVALQAYANDAAFKSMLPEATKCVRSAFGLGPEQQASTAAPAVVAPTAKP